MKSADALFAKLKALVLKANTERDMKRARTCYAIGQVLNKRVPERSTSGKDRISELAKRIKMSSPNLYHCREFAQKFSSQEWRHLQKLAPNLSFGHVVALLSVEKASDRKEYAKQIESDGLSVNALRDRIQADLESKDAKKKSRRGIGGRTVSISSTPQEAWNALLDDLRGFSSRWEVRQDQIREHFKSLSPRERQDQLGKYPESFSVAAIAVQQLLSGSKKSRR